MEVASAFPLGVSLGHLTIPWTPSPEILSSLMALWVGLGVCQPFPEDLQFRDGMGRVLGLPCRVRGVAQQDQEDGNCPPAMGQDPGERLRLQFWVA